MSCTIIDYGSGNLHSAVKSFERAAKEAGLPIEICLSNRPEDVKSASRIVLPGVGAYADCLQGLEAISGMHEALEQAVLEKGTPFFGICVGMQLLSTEGHEHGITKGLNWIPGKVVPIKPADPALKIPHMGWNTLSIFEKAGASDKTAPVAHLHPMLEGIDLGPSGLHAYFVHSYHFEVEDEQNLLLTTDYGGPITAMVGRDNIIGTQFHPEKSQVLGLKLITNFLKWRP